MIKFLDLQKINGQYEIDLKEAANRVIDSGWYVLGNEVSEFETEFSSYCQTKHCLGVANGLDALVLIFRAYIEMGVMQKGDEVIVPSLTFVASLQAISATGAKPVACDVSPDTLLIDVADVKKKFSKKKLKLLCPFTIQATPVIWMPF